MDEAAPSGWGRPVLFRRLAIAQALMFVVALGFLTRWRFQPWRDLAPAFAGADPDLRTTRVLLTIYPSWSFWLAGAGAVAAALAAVWTFAHRLRSASLAGACTVVASMLVGTGIVAWRHWPPAFRSHRAFAGDLPQLTAFAIGLTAAGAAAVVLGLACLAARGAFTWEGAPVATAALCLAGLAVVLALPASVSALDTLGRGPGPVFGVAGLSYAGPWGASIIASAWLRPRVARAVLTTVAATAVLVAFGPHLTLRTGEVWLPFAATAAVALCLVPVPRRARQWRVAAQPAG